VFIVVKYLYKERFIIINAEKFRLNIHRKNRGNNGKEN